MATLQKIRSKGPLLVIVIGLALFAFIAGDAWKIFQPHQANEVGEVNGETLSAKDYQKLVDEYTEVVKFSSGMTSLTDEQTTQIKDEVWRSYVNNKLIETEAKKLGLTVSKAEIQAMINEGTNPALQQTPFKNQKTGMFDKDMLKKFLVDYAKMDKAKMPAQYAQYYESMYKFWTFVEKNLAQSRLAEKYQNLVSRSLISNPIEAKAAFEARVNTADYLVAAIPYTSISDASIKVSDSELKDLYNKKKEQFKQYVESRNIKYIDVQVLPSKVDRAEIEKEVKGYTTQLANVAGDYSTFIRTTESTVPFADLFYTKTAYPTDIAAKIDSAAIGQIYGPYYNQGDNTFNSFKVLAKESAPDSIQFRQIQLSAGTPEKTKALADSVYNVIKAGGNFADIAKKYNGNPEAQWVTSQAYEGAGLTADNVKLFTTLFNLGVNETANIALPQGNIIMQVVDKKAVKDKYKVAVIKKVVNFSKETYNKTYNDFSQFVASNPTIEKINANAEAKGYKLLERNDLYSAEHTIGGIKGTREAMKWAFAAKKGDVSQMFECGESDHLLVVALTEVVKEGYRPMELVKDQLKAEVIKDKKAAKIIADLKAKNLSSFAQCKSIPNVVIDSVKHVSFAAPAYVSAVRSSEPVLSAYASISQLNKLTGPVKGNAAVFVFQPYNKEKLKEVYNQKDEEQKVKSMAMKVVSRFVNDLYIKANVKDTRYLFF
ncbi:SurA N-terminal domain-containing protein [uncultured Bacteroides sp.]|uniref:peptidylprolyl isomerase n=1 Tax=uncultured Bacteroides sp. TaxID=162156 RepID=UPI002AA677F4|nr:SurA N-terminal domain-containing protein [uncultured Bacteroides sp.]